MRPIFCPLSASRGEGSSGERVTKHLGFRHSMDESDRMPEDRDLIVGVIQLGNLFARRLAPMFEKTNLTQQQWTILNVVAESGPMTLAALARKMIVSKQN